ncbi:hypothetical protein LQW54_010018 [Pestalotiopsis sp. IQ-011]
MDLPFVLFIPFGRGGEETNRRIPPASLQLASRTAETFYELVVTVQQGASQQNKYAFPIPLQRYDTLSTFGMYNRPETKIATADNIVTLGISLPRWSYGPMDPITVYIKIAPNLDWMSKARKVTIQKITLTIEEEITYNPEGDEPTKEINRLHKHVQQVGTKLPEAGYVTNMGVIFPHRDLRDSQGIVRRGQPAFPNYEVSSFTTTSTLYKIEFFLNIKASMTSAKDITLRQPIVICPMDHQACKEEMDAIEQAAKDASSVDPHNPMLPARNIVLATDYNALRTLGLCMGSYVDNLGRGEGIVRATTSSLWLTSSVDATKQLKVTQQVTFYMRLSNRHTGSEAIRCTLALLSSRAEENKAPTALVSEIRVLSTPPMRKLVTVWK